jgi:hypothetical protein
MSHAVCGMLAVTGVLLGSETEVAECKPAPVLSCMSNSAHYSSNQSSFAMWLPAPLSSSSHVCACLAHQLRGKAPGGWCPVGMGHTFPDAGPIIATTDKRLP